MDNISDIADVVELHAWATDRPYSISSLKEELEAALPNDDAERAEDYAREVFEEIADRARLLGVAYPFSVDGVTLTPNDRKNDSSYLFCLGLNFFDDIPADFRTREFEGIVKAAAEGYFRGKGLRIGAPWKTEDIKEYTDLLQLVSDLIPDLGPPSRTRAPKGGDAGWDIVVVNNFADAKFSRIIALGNCATGRTDWLKKGNETGPNLFWSFFNRSPMGPNVCLTFFAVPFLMTEEDKLRKVSDTCMTFDRIRICEHVPFASEPVMHWLESHRINALDVSLI
jgi:hypothetical protein